MPSANEDARRNARRIEIEQRAKKRVADLRCEAQAIARGTRRTTLPQGVNLVHHAVHHEAKKVDLSSVVPLLAKIARLLYHRTLARALEGFTIGMREDMRTVALYEATQNSEPLPPCPNSHAP